ncbi:MAG: hypothetical protein MSA63_00070 [Actinomyces urogenitalis]|nr:hypothetical protein [Actinomyces urogenitalis]MCI7455840.1 hypothetical protein [Actinomyces urogenitalis]
MLTDEDIIADRDGVSVHHLVAVSMSRMVDGSDEDSVCQDAAATNRDGGAGMEMDAVAEVDVVPDGQWTSGCLALEPALSVKEAPFA